MDSELHLTLGALCERAAQRWPAELAIAFDATGALWVCSADNISLSPYGGYIEADGIRTTFYNRGPVAIVLLGVITFARRASWGAIKQYVH